MEKIIKNTSIFIYILINVLFITRYSSRITHYYYFLSLGYAVTLPVLLYLTSYIQEQFFTKKIFFVLVILFIAFSITSFAVIPQESLRVDRYEMIRLFWDNFFDGINPYTPRSFGTNIPGPFPFYFYLALPFYAIGEIGYFSLLGFILFVLLLRKAIRDERDRIVILLALILSPAYSWEIICRSTLFLNSALVLACIFILTSIDINKNKNIIIGAILFGLILSTRSIVLIIMFPYLLFIGLHRMEIKKISLWVIGIGAGFIATFLPIIFFQGFFLINNPFAVQNIFLPIWLPIIILLLMTVISIKIKHISDFIFYSMISTVVLVFAYFLVRVMQFSFSIALFKDGADISYIILSLPFVLFGIRQKIHLSKNKIYIPSEEKQQPSSH